MKYTKGSIGRIFLLKFEDDDIVLNELDRFARHEKLKAATFIFLGALKKGHIVTGPKKPVIPPEPNWKKFKDGWEVMGVGTIFMNKKGPQIHIHTSMGKSKFVRELTASLQERLLKAVQHMPADWDGIEIRKYLQDMLEDANVEVAMRGNTGRGRAYANERATNSKL